MIIQFFFKDKAIAVKDAGLNQNIKKCFTHLEYLIKNLFFIEWRREKKILNLQKRDYYSPEINAGARFKIR
jgi:hypothetical protein